MRILFLPFEHLLYNPLINGNNKSNMGKIMKTLLAIVLMSVCFIGTMQAQERPNPNKPQGANLELPEGWEIRLDHPKKEVVIGANPDSSDIYFVNMTPGWHITTGPAAIFYHPANTASGNYTVTSDLHLFDPGNRNREAYGIFIGGQNLQQANQYYLYFLIRNTGEFLIKKRMGEETATLQGWTPSDAIVKYENPDESSVKNSLSVSVAANKITFSINGTKVATIDKGDLQTDGLYGLRVNHSINIHISDLRMTER
jgi:hypothetical protein